jgi:Outer membrane protein beta-barrel domain
LRKLFVIVFSLCLLTAAGAAQIPTSGNVYFGYSLNHGSTGVTDTGTLNGWEGTVEGNIFPHVGLVADVSQQYGTLFIPFFGEDASETTTSYLFGPRVSFRIGKFRPYVHALIGAGHLHESVFGVGEHGETAYADAIGGGVDYHLLPHLSWRVQLDALQTNFHSSWQDNTRFSTGLAFSF